VNSENIRLIRSFLLVSSDGSNLVSLFAESHILGGFNDQLNKVLLSLVRRNLKSEHTS
jgi:hypothetical protein